MGVYKNVMEMLVEEEVSRQFKSLSPRMASYVNPVELVAYALNQLPALYATTEKGLEYQLERGRAKYNTQVAQAVQRAIAAISRDPLRAWPPLPDQQSTPLREVLHQMRLLLRNDKVDWNNLPMVVEQALTRASQSNQPWDTRSTMRAATSFSPLHRSPYPQASSTPLSDKTTSRKSPRPPRSTEPDTDLFGWDDPLYNSR